MSVQECWRRFESAASTEERAIYLCAIFTAGAKNPSKKWQLNTDVPFYKWMLSLPEKAQLPLRNWIAPYVLNQFVAYFLWLYNKDYGHTRRICERMVTMSEDMPPYLSLVIFNALATRLSASQINRLLLGPGTGWEPVLQELVGSDWFDTFLDSCTQPLRYYGGGTNTVLGMYDSYFQDKVSCGDGFNRDAECQYDLGGGFATSDLNRAGELNLTSCDILNPDFSQLDSRLIIRRMISGVRAALLLNDEEKRFHIERQREIKWHPWHVTDPDSSFDASYRSYAFTSTGFLTSTVRPIASKQDNLTHADTSLFATFRIMELVDQGKDVSLFLIHRATLAHRVYKVIQLRFQKGTIVHKALVADRIDKSRLEQPAIDEAACRIMAPSFQWR